MSTLLKNAIILDTQSPYHQQKKDILITNGKIEKIADTIAKKTDFEVIELENLHVSCGWFDTSVSFGEPGFEERETIENGLNVAAKSGFTRVAVNSNTNPVIDSKSDVEFLINKSKYKATKIHERDTTYHTTKDVFDYDINECPQANRTCYRQS